MICSEAKRLLQTGILYMSRSEDIDTFAQNITTHIISLAKDCISNKVIRIGPSDLPWLTVYLRKCIQKRKRAYRRAKWTNLASLASHLAKFKTLRNKTISILRDQKRHSTAKLLINYNLNLFCLKTGVLH